MAAGGRGRSSGLPRFRGPSLVVGPLKAGSTPPPRASRTWPAKRMTAPLSQPELPPATAHPHPSPSVSPSCDISLRRQRGKQTRRQIVQKSPSQPSRGSREFLTGACWRGREFAPSPAERRARVCACVPGAPDLPPSSVALSIRDARPYK